eukprot:7402774-Alexandrium_andersonii.AAC.1
MPLMWTLPASWGLSTKTATRRACPPTAAIAAVATHSGQTCSGLRKVVCPSTPRRPPSTWSRGWLRAVSPEEPRRALVLKIADAIRGDAGHDELATWRNCVLS